MNEFFRKLNVPELRAGLETWVDTHVLAVDNAVQAGLILLALLLGRLLGPRLRKAITATTAGRARHAGGHDCVARLAALSVP
ncbi:MAG: hypothetical protein OXH64_10800, partial [Rhodospirillaceae bacterium]|nr:hypothetical protein [Rhodospirillaceae bacterium]